MASALAVTEIGINAMAAAAANPTVAVPAGGVPRGAFVFVAFVTDSAGTETGVSDTQGNKYNLVAAGAFNTSADRVRVYGAFVTNALVSGNTITVNITSNQLQIQAFYITGQAWGEYAAARDVVEQLKSNAATATALTATATGTTQEADTIVIGIFGAASGTTTFAAGTGFVQTGLTNKVASGSFTLGIVYAIETARASYTPAATLGTSSPYGALTVVMRASKARLLPQPGARQAVIRAATR